MKEHKWEYCDHCSYPVVICGGCGNNCCNGGGDCERCNSAYELQSSMEGCPKEYIEKAERTHRIHKMKVEEVKKELQEKLSLEDVELLLEQYEHLTRE